MPLYKFRIFFVAFELHLKEIIEIRAIMQYYKSLVKLLKLSCILAKFFFHHCEALSDANPRTSSEREVHKLFFVAF